MANADVLRAVLFRVGDVVCALPAGIVREILPPLSATRIPGATAAVRGLVNLRGALLTVVDAHALLGRPALPDDEGAIVVVDRGTRRYGLTVSQVLDFVHVPAADVEPSERLPGIDARVARGVGRVGDRHFILLDLESLLAPALGAADTA